MNVARFAHVAAVDPHRDSRMNPVHKLRKKFLIESMPDELEHLQTLSPFAYSSTGSPNEQLSINSRSESGRYTMTSTGTWSGIPVSGLSNTSVDTYVNQSSCLVSNFLDHRRYTTIGNTDYFIGSSRVGLTGQKLAVTDKHG